MSEDEKHLSGEQVESLLGMAIGVPGDGETEALLQSARRHLANCEACQRLVSMHEDFSDALRHLRRAEPTGSSEACPPASVLEEVAAGMIQAKEAEEFLKHAFQCDHCGPLLREAMDIFAMPQTSDEFARLAALRTSAEDWQARFAQKVASLSDPSAVAQPAQSSVKVGWLSAIPRWGYVAAALVFLVSASIALSVWRSSPAYTNRLLAQAYTDHRTIELRIPGARYARSRVTRSPQVSNVERPAALLEAEALIAREIRKQPRNTRWLQAKVRSDLLDGNYDSAIESARVALEEAPESSDILSDLGMAYFERAESNHSAVDYAQAYQLLSKSLYKHPDDSVLLFNHAIVSEREQFYEKALEDWKRYFTLHTDPSWQEEAQLRMHGVEEKLQEQKNRSRQSLDSPDEFLSEFSVSPQDPGSAISSRADSYQVLAVSKWIPELTSDRLVDSQRRDSLEKALAALAEHLRLYHNDAWLTDFLSETSVLSRSRATQLLAEAIDLAAHGNQEAAIRAARESEKEFDSEHAEAGRVRAAFQEVYSDRLAAHGRECYDHAERLLDDIAGRDYSWLEIQTRLEAAACAAEISKIDESVAGSQAALLLARKANYGNLLLRATMFAADLLPEVNTRLDLLRDGLDAFWNGAYEPMRGYSFYAALDTTATDLHWWFLDEAAIQEGLRLVEDDPNKSLQGLERYRLARAQLAIGKADEAKRTVENARVLLMGGPTTPLHTDALIDFADALVLTGRYQDALDLLASAESNLQGLTQDIVLEKFYVTRASALMGSGHQGSAEEAMVQAFGLARRALASISDESDRLSWQQTLEPVYRSFAYLELRRNARASLGAWELFKGGTLINVPNAAEVGGSLEAWQSKLPVFPSWMSDGTILLSYGVFPEGVAVWSYDGNQVRSMWLPESVADLESLANRFYENCRDSRSAPETLEIEGRELYNLLVKPVGEWLRGRSHLIIETDGSLESVSFEALVDGDGKYLGDSHDIEYSAGLFFLRTDGRPERIGRDNRALVIGQSLGSPGDFLNALPEARVEAREIAAQFTNSVLLLDQDASLARILQELPQSEIFHFAGHAIASGQFAGLFLAPSQDGNVGHFLDAHSVRPSFFRRSRLVVLSACSTANGTGRGLNSRDSLARTALVGGATAVFASGWVVDSLATRELMKVFYERAGRGESIPSAARQARIALKANKEWRHPFFWTSFHVFV